MRKKFFLAVSLFLVVLLSICSWLLVSSTGNQLLIQWSSGENLKVGSFSGSFWNEMQIESFEYHDEQYKLKINKLQLRWQPKALFKRLLHVEQLLVSDITYVEMGQGSNTKSDLAIALPLALQFDKLDINAIKLKQAGNDTSIDNVRFKVKSQGNSIKLSDIEISYLNHQLKAEAEVALEQHYPFNASINWQGELPEVGPASGNAQIDGDLKAVNLKLATDSPFKVSTHGQISLSDSAPKLKLQGEWNNFQWPLNTAADITSQSGQFTLAGPLDKLALNTSASLGFPHTTALPVQARLQGDLTPSGISSLSLDVQFAESSSQVTGQLQWEPAVDWNLSVKSRNFNPSLLHKDWQGQIALDAAVQGGMSDKGLWLNSDLQQLTGKLRGYPIQASGKARYAQNATHIETLKVLSGPNSLEAAGVIADRLQLQYAVDARNLAASWPGLQGKLQASGKLSGKFSDPEVTAMINASDMAYQQYRINTMDANIVWQDSQADGKVDINGFSLPGLQGKSLLMNISGTPEQHDIQILLDASELQLNATAQGIWQAPQWQGQINQLEIDQPEMGYWINVQPIKLQASKDSLRIEQSCFTQNITRLCSTVQWQETNTKITATLKDLPLKTLLQPLAAEAQIEGKLNGELELQGPVDALRGQAQFKLEQGLVTVDAGDDPLTLELRDGLVELHIAPDSNKAELRLKAGTASILAQATTGSLARGTAARIKGNLNAEIPQLSQVSMLLPELTEVNGRVRLQATLAGTFDKPEVEGFLELENASGNIPQLGLNLEKANLMAKSRGTERIVLQGDVTSGAGKLDLNGEVLLDRSKGWPLKLSAEGENLQLARLPEAEIVASPNLEIQLANHTLDIKGSILIPQANIEIRELPKKAVSLSDDELIIGDSTAPKATDPLLVINTQVVITLGDQVRFKGFGLNTRIQGGVELHGSEGKNLAQGQLSLKEGYYKAYGQDLTIEHGRLLFNGPAPNPDLDIKATRLSQDEAVTAILSVSGSLRKPLVTVSSTPSLPDEEALSYLLTGRGLDEKGADTITMLRLAAASKGLDKSQEILDSIAAGVGIDKISLQEGATLEDTSLLLGKYLSPDLYVSYAMGLFDNEGALVTRYRLSKRLRLEVQSGTAQSMDLIYDVEK